MVDRPRLGESLDEHEFSRWYWTMSELQPFARHLGVSAAGPKAELSERIAAKLGGRPQPSKRKPRPQGPQLSGPLTRSTQIPEGQRSSDALRTFFETEIGSRFTFNGHMRSFVLAGGATLGDAIDHWHRTIGTPLPAQSESLEFNHFTRAWHESNPGGATTECRQAWARHRALPADQRPPTT